jgi:hypothetical protein
MQKWTKEKVDKIQKMFDEGKTRQEIADEMGVTKSTLIFACRAYFIKFPLIKPRKEDKK